MLCRPLRRGELNIYKDGFKWAVHSVPPTHGQSPCSTGPLLKGHNPQHGQDTLMGCPRMHTAFGRGDVQGQGMG